jgi:hypothetical protein
VDYGVNDDGWGARGEAWAVLGCDDGDGRRCPGDGDGRPAEADRTLTGSDIDEPTTMVIH